jgi:hypothetical protein
MNPENTVECEDISSLVDTIFSKPPGEVGSNRFDLDPRDYHPETTDHVCFRLLGQLFTRGLLYLFGDNVSLDDLTQSQLSLIQQYLASFGYTALIDDTIPLAAKKDNVLPWILQIRHPPGQGQYHKVVFQTLT